MSTATLPVPDYAQAMRVVGHSDQGGRPDAMQLMVYRGHAYIGHLFSGGLSILDVTDPRNVRPVQFQAAPPNTWNIHLQAADDLLLVVHAKDLWAEFRDESAYYSGSVGTKLAGSERTWSAGMAIYDISRPAQPRQIGFLPVNGVGVHRIWYPGGRWAYVSALPEGYSDYILHTVDLADPTNPVEAGRFWLPGMHTAGGEEPTWDAERWRYALHHAIVAGDTAYASWRDGGLTLIDVSDRARPELIVHRNWSPPFGGGTHTSLPLPARELLLVADEATGDELSDGLKHTWIFDIREPTNPISIATLPTPHDADYATKGAHFGPHNLHENRPGSFISDTLVFATYQNAGVRVFDISDPYRPRQVGALVPPPPARLVDTRPGRPQVIQTADVFATQDGLVYLTDYNAGLYITEYTGVKRTPTWSTTSEHSARKRCWSGRPTHSGNKGEQPGSEHGQRSRYTAPDASHPRQNRSAEHRRRAGSPPRRTTPLPPSDMLSRALRTTVQRTGPRRPLCKPWARSVRSGASARMPRDHRFCALPAAPGRPHSHGGRSAGDGAGRHLRPPGWLSARGRSDHPPRGAC